MEILERATALLLAEPNMLEVEAPVTVCGDTHGQVCLASRTRARADQ